MINITQLHLKRGDRTLLHGLSHTVEAGRITVIMGPNGAGKSSLLFALSGMLITSSGIRLQGKPLESCSREEVAKQIAWQGDLPPTEFGLTVQQRLQLASGEMGLVEKIDQESLMRATVSMEVEGFIARTLGELSSGERQRVELAALMLRDCPVWLLDEPTSHLDLRHQVICLNMLRKQAQSGRAIVVVLHDIQQAMAIADDVIFLVGDGGSERGEAGEMFTRSRLEAVFQVPLQESTLRPNYSGGLANESAR